MRHKKIVDPEVRRIKAVKIPFLWGDLLLDSSELVLKIKQLAIEKANFQASSLALHIVKSLEVDHKWLLAQFRAKVSKEIVIRTVIDHYRIKGEVQIGEQMIYKYIQSSKSQQPVIAQSKSEQVQKKNEEASILKRFLLADSLEGMERILQQGGYLVNKQIDLGEKRWRIIDSTSSKDIKFLQQWIEQNEIKYGLQ